MPWKEKSIMDERMRFVARLREGERMSEFGGGRMRALGALRGTDIKLSEEQQQKVADLYAEYQKKHSPRAQSRSFHQIENQLVAAK